MCDAGESVQDKVDPTEKISGSIEEIEVGSSQRQGGDEVHGRARGKGFKNDGVDRDPANTEKLGKLERLLVAKAKAKGANIQQSAGRVTRQKDLQFKLEPPDPSRTYAIKCNFLPARHAGMLWRAFLKMLPEGKEKGNLRKLLEAHSELKARLRPSSAVLRLKGRDGKLVKEINLGMTTLDKITFRPEVGAAKGQGQQKDKPVYQAELHVNEGFHGFYYFTFEYAD